MASKHGQGILKKRYQVDISMSIKSLYKQKKQKCVQKEITYKCKN